MGIEKRRDSATTKNSLDQVNQQTKQRMQILLELSQLSDGGADPSTLSEMDLLMKRKSRKSLALRRKLAKNGVARRPSLKPSQFYNPRKSIIAISPAAAGGDEWTKVNKPTEETKSKTSKPKKRRGMKRKFIRDLEDLDYVPDPLNKRPAEYYLPLPYIPWELRFSPFNSCFKSSQDTPRIPDFLFFAFNLLVAPILGVYGYAGMACHAFHDSILALRPEEHAEFPAFKNNIRPAIENSSLNHIGLILLGVCALNIILTAVGVHAVYHGKSKLIVAFTALLAIAIGLEWHIALYYAESSLCSQLTDLHGAIKHLVVQFWDHPHTHNRFGPHIVINSFQLYLRCCGYDGPLDYTSIKRDPKRIRYPVPMSCCSPIWNRNIFCSNVHPLDSSNPDFANKIMQRGCYKAVMQVCESIIVMMNTWVWIGVIAHTVFFIGILVSVLLQLALLRRMCLNCHEEEFALRSYIIPDEPLVRRVGGRYGDKRDDEDVAAGLGAPMKQPPKLPPRIQKTMDNMKKKHAIGNDKYGLEVEEQIRKELKEEAALLEQLEYIEEAATELEEHEEEVKRSTVMPNIADSKALFSTGRYKFVLPLDDPLTKKLLPKVLRGRRTFKNIPAGEKISMATLTEDPKERDSEHSSDSDGEHKFGVGPLDEKEVARRQKKEDYEKDLANYEAKMKKERNYQKIVHQHNVWTWKEGGTGRLITSIPSDDDIPKGIKLPPKKSKPEIVKMGHAKKFKKPERRPQRKFLNPKEVFEVEDEIRILDIIEETKKLVAEEPSLAKRNFLEKIAENKIKQIRNKETEKRRIVILEDRLTKRFGKKARRQSFDISTILTPSEKKSRLAEAEAREAEAAKQYQ